RDLLPKLAGAQESHGAPPGYYTALVVASFWPASHFIVPALIRGWRRCRDPAERFLVAWLVPAWAFYELVPTKLPHYVLTLYPALALLAGGAVAEGVGRPFSGWPRGFDLLARALWGLVTVALAIALILLPTRFGGEVSPA